MVTVNRELFRCEYWSMDEGLIVRYHWAYTQNELEDMSVGDENVRLYKVHQASPYEVEAWTAGFDDGHDMGTIEEMHKHDNGIRYQVVFAPESVLEAGLLEEADSEDFTFIEQFICGVCNLHRDADQKSGAVVHIGLYGTEWQVCLECWAQTNPEAQAE